MKTARVQLRIPRSLVREISELVGTDKPGAFARFIRQTLTEGVARAKAVESEQLKDQVIR